jgi:uncharacterized coiled-coil protein SlyX
MIRGLFRFHLTSDDDLVKPDFEDFVWNRCTLYPAEEGIMFEEQSTHAAGWKAMAALGAVAMMGLGGLGIYAEHEHRAAAQATTQTEQMSAALSSTRSEIDELNSKINTLNSLVAASNEQQQAAPARVVSTAPKAVVHRKAGEDSRYKKLQSQVDAQGKAIDDTRSDLSNTRTELTGSIARTHDELVLLQKKGERNYYEFDVAKSKQFNFDGPVGIRLKKANVKHDYADLELMIDDRSLSQKHVNIYQPVMFYTPDIPQPIELVINSVTKDHIRGYISSPKYRQSELASMQTANAGAATTAAGTTATPGNVAPVRQKLPAPR